MKQHLENVCVKSLHNLALELEVNLELELVVTKALMVGNVWYW